VGKTVGDNSMSSLMESRAPFLVLFRKRVCGPLANSLFHHRPDKLHLIDSTLEKAHHQQMTQSKNLLNY
jgi:hypothetical protein